MSLARNDTLPQDKFILKSLLHVIFLLPKQVYYINLVRPLNSEVVPNICAPGLSVNEWRSLRLPIRLTL
jgi:hypothetical protein